jgi:hypothetical protein
MLFKNFMWAAWWPYYTALLTLEKVAAQQAAANRPKSPPEPPPIVRGATRHEPSRESRMSADDALMKAEIPPALRELMKLSIEQARRGFETFVSTSEKAWKSIESGSPAGRAGLFALNAKIVEIARLNAEANFALAAKLTESRDLAQAIELQNPHVKQQMESFVRQLEEMRDLAAQMIQDAGQATRNDADTARSAGLRPASGGGFSSSSYAPSSSFTPGETGRTY